MTTNPPDRPDRDDDLTGVEDDTLGAALAGAIESQVDTALTPPPVTAIAERAAARAQARTARRVTGTVAASVVLLAGGIIGWNSIRDDEPGVIAAETVEAPEPDAAAAEGAAGDGSAAPAPPTEALSEPAPPGIGYQGDPVVPAELSTGPLLEWTEVAPDLGTADSLQSLGDGRVMVRSWEDDGTIHITADGATWTEVTPPTGLQIDRISASGDNLVVTSWDVDTFDAPPLVHASSDGGATWTPVELEAAPVAGPEGRFVSTGNHVSAVLARGERIVVAIQSFTELDLRALFVELGYASDVDDILGWGHGGGEVSVDIGDPISGIESITIPFDELGLSADERAALEGGPDNGRLRIYAGTAPVLSLIEELPGGGGAHGVVGRDGFALTVFGEESPVLLTSPDGLAWQRTPMPDYYDVVAGIDGSLWGTTWVNGGFAIAGDLESGQPRTIVSFEGIEPNGVLSVGPSGVATTAWPAIPYDPTLAEEAQLPTGTAQKDGYELRFGDPEGGISLWDIEAGEPVYVYGPETIDAEEPPEGVREVEGDGPDGFSLTFVDPETGDDLVQFTAEDLIPIFGSIDGLDQPAQAPIDESFEVPRPRPWVGWSADGLDWGWETVDDAFGLDAPDEAWAEIAVGDGFVLARVEVFAYASAEVTETFETEGGAVVSSGEAVAGPVQEPRWFIASIPN